MDGRKSFLFYRSYYEAAAELEDKDRLAYLDAVCRYGLYGEEPELTGALAALFRLTKPNLDACQSHHDAGAKGGRPISKNQTETKPKPKQNQTETKNNQNKTKTKPNENQIETKPKPNENQIETKPKPNRNQTETGEGEGIGVRSIEEEYIPPISPLAGGENDGFSRFWAAYPRKVGKQAAIKEWSRLKPSAELTEALIKAVEYQKQTDQWAQDGGRYIPHASTWLHGRRWEDEVVPAKSAPKNSFCAFDQRDTDLDALLATESRGGGT